MSAQHQVLFLADALFEEISGGSQKVAAELAAGLSRLGIQPTFLVPAQNNKCRLTHSRVTRYPKRYPWDVVWNGRAACKRLLSEKAIDLVHTHFAYTALGPLSCVSKKTPHIRSFYGPWQEEGWVEDCDQLLQNGATGFKRAATLTKYKLKRALRRQIEAINLQRSDRVIVLSEHSRREVEAFGYPSQRIIKIPAGVDVDRFCCSMDREEARRRLHLPTDHRILLSIRRLVPRMGLDNLIQAMPSIVAQFPNTLLLIGGTGMLADHLRKRIVELQLERHVQLLGYIPEEQLADYYQASDLFVLPSIALEGFGLVTLEALACGTPVIGTPVGATSEILGEFDSRLITKGIAPHELAERVISFFDGDWQQELTRRRVSEFVRQRYTWDRHVAGVKAVYEDVLEKYAKHSPRSLSQSCCSTRWC